MHVTLLELRIVRHPRSGPFLGLVFRTSPTHRRFSVGIQESLRERGHIMILPPSPDLLVWLFDGAYISWL